MNSFRKLFLALILVLAVSPLWAKPNQVVVGYSAAWFDGIYPIESYNFDTFTHILRAFLTPRPNGDVDVPGGFFDPELEKAAHAHGVKLLASIGGAAENADNWLKMARDKDAQTRFFDNLDKLITDNHYDGVDIDWEPSALTDPDQATFTQFIKDLRQRFPAWTITAALGGGEWWAQHISYQDVAAQLDFINLMAYDFSGGWSGHAGYNAGLGISTNSNVKNDENVEEMVGRLQSKYHVPKSKLVLGVPFYGTFFFSKHMGDAFVGHANDGEREMQYYELEPLTRAKNYKLLWDDGAKVPFLERQDADLVITYDSPKSIRLKCEYAKSQGLAGVMIWNLGADLVGNRTPLLDTVAEFSGVKPMEMPAGGLKKTLGSFAGMVKDAYAKLATAQMKLSTAGKTVEAKAADPGSLPDLTIPNSSDSLILGGKLSEWAGLFALYNRKLQDCQTALDAIPVPEVQGQVLTPGKNGRLLIDNFEKGLTTNALKGDWSVDTDHNNLGTTMTPNPFKPSKGGAAHSAKFAAHISGHYGKSVAPWPYAMLTGTLAPGWAPVDLSQFSAIEFWVKGNNKTYSVLLGRAAVQDYAHFRQDFIAGPKWTKVTLKLADFKQPSWGKPVPFKLSDIQNIAFTPGANFSDEDFDLWVDDITLVK